METENLRDRNDVRELVKEKYGEAALRVLSGHGGGCCGQTAAGGECCGDSQPTGDCCANTTDQITADLYSATEASEVPEDAILASLGCGNPTALTQLLPGEVVLDLGSGGGIDVLLSAMRVGPTGFAYGLDMTDEMLLLAEKNKAEAKVDNVKFLKGYIEDIPLPDESVDVVISNCVINLSSDKKQVLRESFRVLKPGGRFAVSDVVVESGIPDSARQDMELYVGCIAGALERSEYERMLSDAGFVDLDITPTRRYEFSTLAGSWTNMSPEDRKRLDGKVMGAFIRGTKPMA